MHQIRSLKKHNHVCFNQKTNEGVSAVNGGGAIGQKREGKKERRGEKDLGGGMSGGKKPKRVYRGNGNTKG